MNIYLREIYELCAQLDPPLDPIKDKQYFVSVLDEIQRVAVEGLNERSIKSLKYSLIHPLPSSDPKSSAFDGI